MKQNKMDLKTLSLIWLKIKDTSYDCPLSYDWHIILSSELEK